MVFGECNGRTIAEDYIPARGLLALILATGAYTITAAVAALITGANVADLFIATKYVTLFFISK